MPRIPRTSDIVHGGRHGRVTGAKALHLRFQQGFKGQEGRVKLFGIQGHLGVFVEGSSRQAFLAIAVTRVTTGNARVRSVADRRDIRAGDFGGGAPKERSAAVVVVVTDVVEATAVVQRGRIQEGRLAGGASTAGQEGTSHLCDKVFRRPRDKVLPILGYGIVGQGWRSGCLEEFFFRR
jgi:hypothetical protein